jgi:hypothetical protein
VHIKLSRVIIQMKTITTHDNNNNKWPKEREGDFWRRLTRLVKSRYTFQSKYSPEMQWHVLDCYCLITSHEIRSKRKRLVTVLERKRIFVWYNHFYELTYVKKEKKDADLDSRQADTCSFTSVRLKKCWQFSFWSNQYLCERSKHQHVVCSFSFSDQTKTQIINHAAHLH